MAEPPNHMQNRQVNDILSAALGQSGLTFVETEEDDVRDVFAALSADGDFPSYMQQQSSVQSTTTAGSAALKTNKFDAPGPFQNDLDDIMDLINRDPVGNQDESFSDFSHNPAPLVQQQKVYESKKSADTVNSAVLKLPVFPKVEQVAEFQSKEIANLVDSLKESTAGLLDQSLLPPDPRVLFNNRKTEIITTTGLKNVLSLERTIDGSRLQFPIKIEDNPEDTENQEEIEDEEELGYTDTFADYMPSKVKIGKKHPDPVVETSSMASVSPPDVWYRLSLPQEVIEGSYLSALQLEAVIYASQQHEHFLPDGKRAGFLIGDGAGVGKGRTVAGIIYENYILGRKRAIWLSVSNDLRYDAERDLRDIGCNISVNALNKFKYDEKISSRANGKVKKGIVFSTYSSLIGETQGNARFKTRLSQLLHWCGDDYNGVIIFDECHKAKNLVPTGSGKPTKTGITVLQLQDKLPKARIVYCSATGASEPKNMAYMNRLGIWGAGTPFREFSDFIQSVEKRGVGAMELVAMEMKHRGMYIARQLSFAGTSFDVREIRLNDKFVDMYNASVKLWADAREKFEKAADLISLDGHVRKTVWGQFWSAHQRFFKYLCIAAKVKQVVSIAKEAIRNGKCVVIGLQSTGEARTQEQIEDLGGDLNDFISTAKGVLSGLIDKHFPVSGSRFADRSSDFDLNSDGKRKRGWRESIHKKRKWEERESVFDSDSENATDSFATDVDETTVDQINDSDDDSQIVISSSDSHSDTDEDNWLKAFSDEPKSSKKKAKKKQPDKNSSATEDSMSVLNAAGLFGKQFSWADASSSGSALKSSRLKKTNSSQRLTNQISLNQCISTSLSAAEQCALMKNELLEKLDVLAPFLPPNTLDELIDELGGPDHVAEMTGRKNRILLRDDGRFIYESRSKDDVPLEMLNIAEKDRFMSGTKLVAIISEAASSGISLHADRRAKNQKRRIHITLELPWSADKAIQQFGRSHRSNQVSAPEYLFLISELAGERRFASIVAKRLESLGALTHGDRRATESRDLSCFNFDTKYGRSALEVTLKSVLGLGKSLVQYPSDYEGEFITDAKEGLIGVGVFSRGPQNSIAFTEKDYTKVSRFLNRILGLSVGIQNSLFSYFIDTMNNIIKEAKKRGSWDEGIVDLGSQGESVKKLDVKKFLTSSASGQVSNELITVSVERGLPWYRVYDIFLSCSHQEEGFYQTNTARQGKRTVVLVKRAPVTSRKKLYTLYRPNIGMQPKQEQLADVQRKFEKIQDVEAEQLWKDQYRFSENNCSHAYWQGKCKKKELGLGCEVGMRRKTVYVLAGSVLSIWTKIGIILSSQAGTSGKMQIIRVRLDDGTKIVGVLIPSNQVQVLIRTLSGSQNDPCSILDLL